VIDGGDIETASPQFVRQLAAELMVARRRSRRPIWWLARSSHGRFTRQQLHDAESGRLPLHPDTVAQLADVYGIDVDSLLPAARGGLQIRADGLISSGGVSMPFTPGDDTSLVTAYFRLARQLRQQDDASTLTLRGDDLRTIAQFLERSGTPSRYLEAVLAASIAERRVLAGSLIAGAVSIGLAPDRVQSGTAQVDRSERR
jgi:hypothetical protein